MAIPKTLSTNPYEILHPDDRWQPGTEELQGTLIRDNMPPLVDKIRRDVWEWRNKGYPNISNTSRALLNWWFGRDTELVQGVHYYFAQREAMESVIYLYENVKVRDKYDLLRFSAGGVAPEMMEENWRRFVIKMATGSGKTKIMSLIILWSYFHKTYEDDSDLSRNILLIAPNIIVLDRLYRDFQGMRIFYEDGAIPDNGYEGCDWQNDFKMRLHKQDDVRGVQSPGNLYLTNIHRVYTSDISLPTADDENSRNYFLGDEAVDIKKSGIHLLDIVRDTDELMVINDEAHHIHDSKMEWFRSIQGIHNSLVQKGKKLSLQMDLTATPKHNRGQIFVQTISDYPLVEAIHQNIVKRPVVPDEESEAKMKKRQHPKYVEQYADYIKLGVEEWRKARDEHKKAHKKAVLFVMTEDTLTADEVAAYLEKKFSDLEGKVLVIHTKKNGEIDEKAKGKKEKELQQLRQNAAEIDNVDNKYSAVVSVLVLREGWDVRNVTTIVGLRQFSAESKILPEQTLGRGLRLMYGNGSGEKVSVIGTPAFVEFVKEIEKEGVKLEKVQMGKRTAPQTPRVIIIERDNPQKEDIEALDIALPRLSRRFNTDFTQIDNLRAENIVVSPVEYKQYGKIEDREIIFRDVLKKEISHITTLGEGLVQDYSNVIAYFVRCLMNQFRLFSGYNYFYELVELFVRTRLFGKTIPLDSEDTLRNLAEEPTSKRLLEAIGTAISETIRAETGNVKIKGEIRISQMHSFTTDYKYEVFVPRKSLQNYIVAPTTKLELDFARFLDSCPDIITFAKNYLAVDFNIEYVKTDGKLSRYFPDFFVKDSANKVWVIETKGRMDENDRRKLNRLAQWRDDVCKLKGDSVVDCLLVDENNFRNYRPSNFLDITKMFPLKVDK